MPQTPASDLAPIAARAASLRERTAQLEAVTADPDAADIERRHAAASLNKVADAAQAVEDPPQAVEPGLDSPTCDDEHGDAERGDVRAAHVAALNALANLHRRIADRLDPPERSVCLAINADWIDSVMARRDISPDDYDTELILGKLEEL